MLLVENRLGILAVCSILADLHGLVVTVNESSKLTSSMQTHNIQRVRPVA